MTFPTFSTPKNFLSTQDLYPIGEKEHYWFIFAEGSDELLLIGDRSSVPMKHDLTLERIVYMGTIEDKHLFAGEIPKPTDTVKDLNWHSLKELYGVLEDEFYALAGRAKTLLYWDKTHTYCGCCGAKTFPRKTERCRECSVCQSLFYPKLAPAIMALVTKGDQILLARSPHFPPKMYSVLAGFLDPGETLEQCVAREVLEEVGLRIKNMRYFGSQPWPFSQSLMIGFICEWESGDISIDPIEIEDAAWFHKSELPEIPSRLSLARLLIDSLPQEST